MCVCTGQSWQCAVEEWGGPWPWTAVIDSPRPRPPLQNQTYCLPLAVPRLHESSRRRRHCNRRRHFHRRYYRRRHFNCRLVVEKGTPGHVVRVSGLDFAQRLRIGRVLAPPCHRLFLSRTHTHTHTHHPLFSYHRYLNNMHANIYIGIQQENH